MSNDPFAPIGAQPGEPSKAAASDWEIIVPVPPGAKTAPNKHRKLGKPTKVWAYTDNVGKLLGYVARFDGPDGKQFRPLTLWRSKSGATTEWLWTSWPTPRPLYGLQKLAERPSAHVVVAEGRRRPIAPRDSYRRSWQLPARMEPIPAAKPTGHPCAVER
jgi:hypothetical protein